MARIAVSRSFGTLVNDSSTLRTTVVLGVVGVHPCLNALLSKDVAAIGKSSSGVGGREGLVAHGAFHVAVVGSGVGRTGDGGRCRSRHGVWLADGDVCYG